VIGSKGSRNSPRQISASFYSIAIAVTGGIFSNSFTRWRHQVALYSWL